MTISTRIDAKIVASVDQASFKKGVDVARDTGTRINKELRAKLELDVANLQIQLEKSRRLLKDAKKSGEEPIQLQIQSNKLQSELTEAKRALRNYVNTGDQELSRFSRQFNLLGDSISTSLGKVGSQLQGLASGTLGVVLQRTFNSVASGVIGLASKLEQARIKFTGMAGSADEANKHLFELAQFARKTPFELVNIREQSTLLQAYNIDMEKVIPTLQYLGDISALVGTDKMPRLVYALGQVKAAGRLTGQELRQFTETGVPLLEELSKITGIATQDIVGNVSSLNISFEQVETALKNMTVEGGFAFRAMELQSKTLNGSISNLKDSTNLLGETIGTLFIPSLTNTVQRIIPLTDKIGTFTKENQGLTKGIITGIAAFTGLVAILGVLGGIIAILGAGFGTLLIPIVAATAGIAALAGIAASFSGRDAPQMTKEINRNEEALKRLNIAIDEKNKNEISADTAGLEKERQQIIANIIALKQLEIARATVGLQQKKEEFQKSSTQGATFGAGGIAGTYTSTDIAAQEAYLRDLKTNFANIGPDYLKKLGLENKPSGVGGGGGSSSRSGGGGGGNKVDEAQKANTEQIIKYQKLVEKIEEETKNSIERRGKLAFDAFTSAIKDSKQSVEGLNQSLAQTKEEIYGIEGDIAGRAIDLKDSIKKLDEEISNLQSGKGEGNYIELIQKRKKLVEELALAENNVSKETLNSALEDSKKSETQKLIDRKAALEQEKTDLETKINNELALQEELNTKKEELEKTYTDKYGIQLLEQEELLKQSIERRIEAYKQLERARLSAGEIPSAATTSNGGVSNTQNNSNNFNISNNVDVESAVNRVIRTNQDFFN